MTRPEQLPLPLPIRKGLGRRDYFVSSCNAMAVALVEGWANWPGRKLLISGPEACGKTHLAHVWQAASAASVVSARSLAQADIPSLTEGPICVEDIHLLAGARAGEEALFHLHNLAFAQGHPLLMTARGTPGAWALTIPDLRSRLMAVQTVEVAEPDDALLAAVLAKHFADRQIVPAAPVIPYLVGHMPRSFAAARDLVNLLDSAALSRKGAVSRPLAIEILTDYLKGISDTR